MSNPLYNSTNNQQNPFAQIIKQARDFRKQFTGNPRDEVQRLTNRHLFRRLTNRLTALPTHLPHLITR